MSYVNLSNMIGDYCGNQGYTTTSYVDTKYTSNIVSLASGVTLNSSNKTIYSTVSPGSNFGGTKFDSFDFAITVKADLFGWMSTYDIISSNFNRNGYNLGVGGLNAYNSYYYENINWTNTNTLWGVSNNYTYFLYNARFQNNNNTLINLCTYYRTAEAYTGTFTFSNVLSDKLGLIYGYIPAGYTSLFSAIYFPSTPTDNTFNIIISADIYS